MNRLRRRTIVAGVAAIAAAVIGFLWYAMHRGAEEPRVELAQPAADSRTPAPAAESPPPAPPTPAPADTGSPPPPYVAASDTTPSAPGEAQSQVALLRFSAQAAATAPVTFVSHQPRSRPVPTMRREMPLTMGRLEVVVEDREGNSLWRTVIADPRIVRGEFFGPDGSIEESVTFRRDGAASILYPQDDRAYRMVVSEPVRDAGGMGLRTIAALVLP